MKKTVSIKFNFGQEVRLRTDPDKVRIVTRIMFGPHERQYELACGETTSWHSEVEIEPIKIIKIKGFGQE